MRSMVEGADMRSMVEGADQAPRCLLAYSPERSRSSSKRR